MMKNKYMLNRFSRLLSNISKIYKRFDLYEKDFDLDRIFETLNKKKKNDIIIYGDQGSGRHSLLMLMALKLGINEVPFNMLRYRLFEFDFKKMVEYSHNFKKPQEEFPRIFDRVLLEMATLKNAIIYFVGFEHHTYYPDDSTFERFFRLTNFQKVLICTTQEYVTYAETSSKFLKTFQGVKVSSFNAKESMRFLKHVRPHYEFYHNVKLSDENLKLIFDLSEAHFSSVPFPLRAVNLIDHCLSVESLKNLSLSKNSHIKNIIFSTLRIINIIKYKAFQQDSRSSLEFLQELDFIYRSVLLKFANNINLTDLLTYIKLKYNSKKFIFSKRVLKLLYLIISKYIVTGSKLLTESLEEKKELKKGKVNSKLYKIYSFLVFYSLQLFEGSDKELKKPYINDSVVSLTNPDIENNLHDYFTEDILSPLNYYKFFHNHLKNSYSKFCEKKSENIYINFRFKKLKKNIDRNGIFYFFTDKLNDFLKNNNIKTFVQTFGQNSVDIKIILDKLNLPVNSLKNIYKKNTFKYDCAIQYPTIYKVVSNFIGHEITKPKGINYSLLKNLESILKKDVLGQSEAISAISNIIRRATLRVQDPNRPLGSLLFCGSTGVGKTEIVKILVRTLYGSEKDLVRLDMSEFMEKHTVARLVGSPPGYIGHDDGGQLTGAVMRKPNSVILFDEIEKSHPDILTILLQVLDDGRLTDSKQNLVPFNETIIIMTSNVGSGKILDHFSKPENLVQEIEETENSNDLNDSETSDNSTEIDLFKDFDSAEKYELVDNLDFLNTNINNGMLELDNIVKHAIPSFEKENSKFITKVFDIKTQKVYTDKSLNKIEGDKDNSTEELAASLRPTLLQKFLPEFLNRIDKIIIFKPLQKESLRKICEVSCLRYINRMKALGINVTIDESVKTFLTDKSHDPEFGARPLRRNIITFVENLVSTKLVDMSSTEGRPENLDIYVYINSAGKVALK